MSDIDDAPEAELNPAIQPEHEQADIAVEDDADESDEDQDDAEDEENAEVEE